MPGSAGLQVQEEPICVASGVCVDIVLSIAVSDEPTYIPESRKSRSHRNGLRHVENLFGVIASAAFNAGEAASIGGDADDRHAVGLFRVSEIGVEVGESVA